MVNRGQEEVSAKHGMAGERVQVNLLCESPSSAACVLPCLNGFVFVCSLRYHHHTESMAVSGLSRLMRSCGGDQ